MRRRRPKLRGIEGGRKHKHLTWRERKPDAGRPLPGEAARDHTYHRRPPPGPFARLRRALLGRRPSRRIGLALLALLLALHVKPIRTAQELAGRAEPTCRVISFTDGDTLQAWCPGDGLRTIRLTGFDTPEIGGAECLSERLRGFAATLLLAGQVFAAEAVTIRPLGEDRYGRRLGAMFLDGEFLADRMISAGRPWGLARGYDGGRRMSWCSETPRPHR